MMAESNSKVQPATGKGLKGYLKGVEAELKKVVWPTKRELVTYTIAVLILSVFVAAMIYVVDAIFAQLFNQLMHFVGQEAVTWKQIRNGMSSILIQATKIR